MKLNKEQKKLIKHYESLTCYEFMYQDDIKNDETTFYDAWNNNVSWFAGVYGDLQRIDVSEWEGE